MPSGSHAKCYFIYLLLIVLSHACAPTRRDHVISICSAASRSRIRNTYPGYKFRCRHFVQY